MGIDYVTGFDGKLNLFIYRTSYSEFKSEDPLTASAPRSDSRKGRGAVFDLQLSVLELQASGLQVPARLGLVARQVLFM